MVLGQRPSSPVIFTQRTSFDLPERVAEQQYQRVQHRVTVVLGEYEQIDDVILLIITFVFINKRKQAGGTGIRK